MSDDEITPHLQRLYAAPLDAFVSTRNEIVTELKDGSPEIAERIRRAKKPTLPVWVVNQLRTAAPGELERLLDNARSLREALGSGDMDAARAAGGGRKQAVAALVTRAEEVLASAGHASTSATLDKVSTTLLVGATDPVVSERLRLGTLQGAIEPSEVDPFATGMTFPTPDGAQAEAESKDDNAADEERLREAEGRARELAQRAADLETQASGLELDAQRAERAAVKARKEAVRARQIADRAEEELESLRGDKDAG
jgi:hypothetical protein